MPQTDFSDNKLKLLYEQNEKTQSDEDVLEGEEIFEENQTFTQKVTPPQNGLDEEEELRRRIESGEWDNLDDCAAFLKRTPEGQIMSRSEAIDFRIRQLEVRLPLLLNKNLTAAYVQMLKRIRALRMTKTGMLASFYKEAGQRDIESGIS